MASLGPNKLIKYNRCTLIIWFHITFNPSRVDLNYSRQINECHGCWRPDSCFSRSPPADTLIVLNGKAWIDLNYQCHFIVRERYKMGLYSVQVHTDLWDMTRHAYMDDIKQILTPIICLHIWSWKFNHNTSIVYKKLLLPMCYYLND